MRVFFDSEFTGLYQNAALISIGLVAENGKEFYAEFDDYDRPGAHKPDQWVEDNVIKKLTIKEDYLFHTLDNSSWKVKWNTQNIADALSRWFIMLYEESGGALEMWSDCLAYDWVLFCDMFGGAMHIPDCIYYIPMDICTLMKVKGVDPDISREEFVGMDGDKHNSLHDARVIRFCYNKLVKM